MCDTLINKCASNPCLNEGKCHNLIDDYYCECLPEFGQLSKNCAYRTVNPCLISPCLNNGTCTATAEFMKLSPNQTIQIYTGFNCNCRDSFKGTFCEQEITSCSSNPCQNRGFCQKQEKSSSKLDFACFCYAAFIGTRCERVVDQCAHLPCNNGGTCMPTPHGYQCQCPFNFAGKK